MPIEFRKHIRRKDVKAEKSKVFVFGDNEARRGFGGLAAEVRGEPNAIGVRTKRAPTMQDDAFWSDDEFDRVMVLVREDLDKVKKALDAGQVVVFPVAPLGSGLSDLPRRAPAVFGWLNGYVAGLLERYGTAEPAMADEP